MYSVQRFILFKSASLGSSKQRNMIGFSALEPFNTSSLPVSTRIQSHHLGNDKLQRPPIHGACHPTFRFLCRATILIGAKEESLFMVDENEE